MSTTPPASPNTNNTNNNNVQLFDGTIPYMITCLHNQSCLDWNTKQAKQMDKYHPRISLSSSPLSSSLSSSSPSSQQQQQQQPFNPPNPCRRNHLWRLYQAPTTTTTTTNNNSNNNEEISYLLCTWKDDSVDDGSDGDEKNEQGEVLSLDANIQSHISQWDYAFPMPYLYPMRPTHANHQWKLLAIPSNPNNGNHLKNVVGENAVGENNGENENGEKKQSITNTAVRYYYAMVNRMHGKCLDGNVDACTHADMNYKSPFLRQYRYSMMSPNGGGGGSGGSSSRNSMECPSPQQLQLPPRSQLWKIEPVVFAKPYPTTSVSHIGNNSNNRCVVPSGHYLIVNVANGRCLDGQPDKNGQVYGSMNPCVFLGEKLMYNPCLHWRLTWNDDDVGHGGESGRLEFGETVDLTPRFDPEQKQLSGKQSVDESVTIPFLVHFQSLLHVEDKVSYRRWKLILVPKKGKRRNNSAGNDDGSDTPPVSSGDDDEGDAYFIVCVENGLCLSGASYSYPTMTRLDLNPVYNPSLEHTMWRLIPIRKKRTSSVAVDMYKDTNEDNGI